MKVEVPEVHSWCARDRRKNGVRTRGHWNSYGGSRRRSEGNLVTVLIGKEEETRQKVKKGILKKTMKGKEKMTNQSLLLSKRRFGREVRSKVSVREPFTSAFIFIDY